MNNRQKRQMEKDLGILKYKNSLPKKQRFARMRENIIEGKKKQEGMKEIRRLQEQKQKEQTTSDQLSFLATSIMLKEGISYAEAIEKAKKEIENLSKKEL